MNLGKALIGDVNKELYYWDMESEINNLVRKWSETAT